jgi:hypothetical protein
MWIGAESAEALLRGIFQSMPDEKLQSLRPHLAIIAHPLRPDLCVIRPTHLSLFALIYRRTASPRRAADAMRMACCR